MSCQQIVKTRATDTRIRKIKVQFQSELAKVEMIS